MPSSEAPANGLVVTNIRRTIYRDDGEFEVTHYADEFNLDELDSLWFGVQHFASWKGFWRVG